MPLGSLLQLLSPASRAVIFKSGKGVEGFFRLYGEQCLQLTTKDGITSISSTLPKTPDTQAAVAETAPVPVASVQLGMSSADLLQKISSKIAGEKYTAMFEVYCAIFESPEARQRVKLDDFVSFVKIQGVQHFWVHKRSICLRLPGQTSQPMFGASEAIPQQSPLSTAPPSVQNNFGGWGTLTNMPTAADVFEILKYVPVHWGNMGNLNIPADIKKKHVRIASFLQWLRRQPRFFELRNTAGTIEVRRAVVLHPDQHGMTAEQAEAWLDERIRSGNHNNVSATTSGAVPQGVAGGPADPSAAAVSNLSPAALALHKFLVRVCPGYFVPASLILQRYVKKTLSAAEIDQSIREFPNLFEFLATPNGTVLYRKRVGADSSRWRDSFVQDLAAPVPARSGGDSGSTTGDGDDVAALIALMGRCCSLWDRYQYLYVRLSDHEKTLVGGFDGMMEIMRRHPAVFTCGNEFFRRHDPSDPLLDATEASSSDNARVCRQVDENPYLTPRELILVFHYVTTDESPVTAAHLIECSSPAMRSVLPPRLVTLLQMFPEFFTCKEVTPGNFTIRKAAKRSDEDRDTLEGSSLLSRDETVSAVKSLIPARGVDIGQLQLWVSLQMKHAATQHFGGVEEMIAAHPELFYVVPNPPYRTVFLKTKSS
jgi:hypothetical protein